MEKCDYYTGKTSAKYSKKYWEIVASDRQQTYNMKIDNASIIATRSLGKSHINVRQ